MSTQLNRHDTNNPTPSSELTYSLQFEKKIDITLSDQLPILTENIRTYHTYA